MIRAIKIMFLAGCIASSSITVGMCAPTCHTAEEIITDALKAAADLKVGDTRADVERSFELEGGLQSRTKSRYVFKKCSYIKIDVEFTGKGDSSPAGFPSTDIIVQVSKPYLEYSIED
jgi:hypothetical protein